MTTRAMESLLLSQTGDSLYEFDICTKMLQDAHSANCVGNSEKFSSLIRLTVELQLQHVFADLANCEYWTWSEVYQGEAAYAEYEELAAKRLTDLLTDCKFLTPSEMRHHMGEIHRFLGELPGLAYRRIKRVVAATPLMLPYHTTPRPNDIA